MKQQKLWLLCTMTLGSAHLGAAVATVQNIIDVVYSVANAGSNKNQPNNAPSALTSAQMASIDTLTPTGTGVVPVTQFTNVRTINFSPVYSDESFDEFDVVSTYPADIDAINTALQAGDSVNVGYQMINVSGVWGLSYFVRNNTTEAVLSSNTFTSTQGSNAAKSLQQVNSFVDLGASKPWSIPTNNQMMGLMTLEVEPLATTTFSLSLADIEQLNSNSTGAVIKGAGYSVPVSNATKLSDVVFSPSYIDDTFDTFTLAGKYPADLAQINAAIALGHTLSWGYQMQLVGTSYQLAYFFYDRTASQLVARNTFTSVYTSANVKLNVVNIVVSAAGIASQTLPPTSAMTGVCRFANSSTVVTTPLTVLSSLQIKTLNALPVTGVNEVPVSEATVIANINFSPVYKDELFDEFNISSFPNDLAQINAALKAGNSVNIGYQMIQVQGVYQLAYFVINNGTGATIAQNTFMSVKGANRTLAQVNGGVYMVGAIGAWGLARNYQPTGLITLQISA